MKRSIRCGFVTILAVMMCVGMSVFFFTDAQAQQKKPTALEGIKFETGASMADNIKTFTGKDVVVHLKSGKTVQGYVKSVSNTLLHVEKLAGGRDFYDALIRVEDISAIEAKFRDLK